MENIAYRVMGRRGGMVCDANGNGLRNLTAEQVVEYLNSSEHIGTDLDRFLICSEDAQIPGSWFFEDMAA